MEWQNAVFDWRLGSLLLYADSSQRELVQTENIPLEPKKHKWDQKLHPYGILSKQYFIIHKHRVYVWKSKNFIMEM